MRHGKLIQSVSCGALALLLGTISLSSQPSSARAAEDDTGMGGEGPGDEPEEDETEEEAPEETPVVEVEPTTEEEPESEDEKANPEADSDDGEEDKKDEVESESGTVVSKKSTGKLGAGARIDAAAQSPEETTEDDARPGASIEATEEAAEAALVDAPLRGPSLLPLKLSTSTWSRLEVRENYDQLGVESSRRPEGDWVVFRARLGLETNALALTDESDVLLKFTPQASGRWGGTGTVGGPNVGFYEGYMKFRSRRLDTQIGRMALNYGESIVIDKSGFDEAGRAFDGLLFHYKMDHGYLDLIGTQVDEGRLDGADDFLEGDSYFWGLYSGIGGYLGDDIELDLYFLGLSSIREDSSVDPDTGESIYVEGATLFTLGGRVKQKIGNFDYRLEAGLQFGRTARAIEEFGGLESASTLAYHADGEIGYSIGPVTRVSLGGVVASGDDDDDPEVTGWNPLYGTTHAFLGLTDVIGRRTNVVSGNLKVKRGITQDLVLHLDGHIFARPEFGGFGQVGRDEFAGVEVDTQLVYSIGNYAMVRGIYGLFIPSSGHYVTDELVSYGELQAGVEF